MHARKLLTSPEGRANQVIAWPLVADSSRWHFGVAVVGAAGATAQAGSAARIRRFRIAVVPV
jgi:hypothetical protein